MRPSQVGIGQVAFATPHIVKEICPVKTVQFLLKTEFLFVDKGDGLIEQLLTDLIIAPVNPIEPPLRRVTQLLGANDNIAP